MKLHEMRRFIPLVFLVILVIAGVIYLARISGPQGGPRDGGGRAAHGSGGGGLSPSATGISNLHRPRPGSLRTRRRLARGSASGLQPAGVVFLARRRIARGAGGGRLGRGGTHFGAGTPGDR